LANGMAPTVAVAGSLRPEGRPETQPTAALSDGHPEVRALIAPSGVRPVVEPARAGTMRMGTPLSDTHAASEAGQESEASRKQAGSSSRTAKKVPTPSAAEPRTHVTAAPKAPAHPARPEGPPAASPSAPATSSPSAKKGDTLNDLFNDTK